MNIYFGRETAGDQIFEYFPIDSGVKGGGVVTKIDSAVIFRREFDTSPGTGKTLYFLRKSVSLFQI